MSTDEICIELYRPKVCDCGQAKHEGPCLDAVRGALQRLVQLVGTPGQCQACHKQLYFVRHRNGKLAPYTLDGLNHYIDCEFAERFRGKR